MASLRVAVVLLATPFALSTALAAQETWLEPATSVLLDVESTGSTDYFGWTVAGVGDVNGDSVADVAVSADFAGTGGKVYVHSGADGSLIWSRKETLSSAVLGFSMETLDWNGDGVLDVLAAAPFNGPTGGRVFVFSGVDGETLHLFNPSDGNDEGFGGALATGGDFNGDGVDDVAISAFLMTVAPPTLIDFETADDFVTVLHNGQSLGEAEFNSLFSLTTEGSGHYGAAIFDSNPLGPNAESSDPDLLVGRGKLLILQEDPAESARGSFERPDDAAAGGVFRFTFRELVQVSSIGLVDICPGQQQAIVTLYDEAGSERVYHVPGGWTGDVAVHGTGYGKLDLTTLADQPGLFATATAHEDAGFDPMSCETLTVELASSGAIANIDVDHGMPELDSAGRVYVFSGTDASIIATIDGPTVDAELGLGLAFVGDVSVPADGRSELVAGHRLDEFFEGQARVFSFDGEDVVLLSVIDDVGMGYNLGGDRIDAGKDVDGDGIDDILIGDRFAERVDVVSGADRSVLYRLEGKGDGGSFGSCRAVDDVDGDGNADILVSSWSTDVAVNSGGRVYLYSGVDGALIRTITPLTATRRFGADVRSAGDVDGDGIADILVGATGGNFSGPPKGRAFVISGSQRTPAQRATRKLRAASPR